MKHFYVTLRIAAIALYVLSSLQSSAIMIGSDFFTFTQAHVVFPADNNDNSVANFSLLKNGFTLQDASTTCTFNSIYPVSGLLEFNGGTLILEADFVLKDSITWASFGTIIGNGYNIDFTFAKFVPASSPTFPTFQDVTIYLDGNFTLNRPYHFKGNCKVIGNNNLITILAGAGAVVVDPGSTLTLHGLTFSNVTGTNIRCTDDAGVLILDNTNIIQSGDYSFSTGRLSFLNNVNWQGASTFLYDSMQSSTVQTASVLQMSNSITFSIGRLSDTTLIEPLTFVDQTSVLLLNNATLSINSHGTCFIHGSLETSGNVLIDVASTATNTALEFGDGILADDMYIQFNAGSNAEFRTGLVVWNNAGFQLTQNGSASAVVTLDAASVFLLKNNYEVAGVTFNPDPASVLEIAPGKQLLFSNVNVLTANGGSYIVTGFYQPGVGFLLDGNQSMNIISGSVPVALLIDNPGNILIGAGDITLPIILLDSNTQLTWALTGELDTNLTMNGGLISLTTRLNMGHDVVLSGSGTVNLDNHSMVMGYIDTGAGSWVDPLYWRGSIGAVILQSNVVLDAAWTFSGSNYIVGNGNILDITNGALIVAPGSTLELHNVTLQGISGTNVRCLDKQGVVILDNSTWFQDGYFTFTQGAMIFENGVSFKGIEVFAYETMQTSTITANSIVTFDSLFTFSYDPGTSPNLLEFTDRSSILTFNGSTLFVGQSELNLTKGSCFVQSGCVFASTSTITVGDCFNPSNDFAIAVVPNAQLEIFEGNFNYKNVSPSSWVMQGTTPILRTDGGAALNLYQVLNLGTGSAVFGNNATIGNQSNLIGSSSQEGTLNTVTLPPC
ncbi:MAG: hypothetical protein P4L31_02825 [Candidatus Babeliales bacterium]|nr:hypothetical protein [Candidatus Babeliales bacterium]